MPILSMNIEFQILIEILSNLIQEIIKKGNAS